MSLSLSHFIQNDKLRAQNAVGTRTENTLKWYVDGKSKKRAHVRCVCVLDSDSEIAASNSAECQCGDETAVKRENVTRYGILR